MDSGAVWCNALSDTKFIQIPHVASNGNQIDGSKPFWYHDGGDEHPQIALNIKTPAGDSMGFGP